MISLIIRDDETGEQLTSRYESKSLLCDALEYNMPNLGRMIRRKGLGETIATLMVLALAEKREPQP